MDPVPGCSHVQSELNYGSKKVHKIIKSIKNLEDNLQVRHGHFRWSIEKFSFFPEEEGISCCSPIFNLKETSWYIAVCPNSKSHGQNCVSMHLVRHEKDLGPETVVVSYALGLENLVSKVWFKVEENVIFKKGDHDGLRTSVLGNLQRFFKEAVASNEDSLSVVCEVYVSYLLNRNEAAPVNILPIDQLLSSNLVSLFTNQKKTDVLLEVRNYRVWVHKSILCARSRTLANMLEDGKCFIKLSCSASCLECVVFYMYSGSFDCLVKNASFGIGLYEIACELSLSNLRDMLTPYKIDKKSQVQVHCFRRTCTIHGFDLDELHKEEVKTPVFFDKTSGMNVKICMYKLNPNFVGINVEIGGISRLFHIVLNLSLLNKNCAPHKDVPAELLPDSSVEFRGSTLFASFLIPDEDVLSSVTKGRLYVNLACTKYSLAHESNLPENICSLPTDCRGWIKELSSDLKSLLKTGQLSDITLLAQRERFQVHRSILAARSPFFKVVLWQNNYLHRFLEVRDVEPRILRIMLTYIYCGTIDHMEDLTLEDFSKLVKPSMKCRIQSLVDICATFLNI